MTAGGVELTEIDPATMESRMCPGLFLVGEILDVDGRIGGFNFQWAWSSAAAAAAGAGAPGELLTEFSSSVLERQSVTLFEAKSGPPAGLDLDGESAAAADQVVVVAAGGAGAVQALALLLQRVGLALLARSASAR